MNNRLEVSFCARSTVQMVLLTMLQVKEMLLPDKKQLSSERLLNEHGFLGTQN